mmetsp:Transcript_11040/g.24098  ORF Transcript_11040/g.24098 Transcript_11040/m.24098 type:complete len:86 (-) Transcript_11040:156-413(-)
MQPEGLCFGDRARHGHLRAPAARLDLPYVNPGDPAADLELTVVQLGRDLCSAKTAHATSAAKDDDAADLLPPGRQHLPPLSRHRH